MSSYLSKSKKAFKPKVPSLRAGAATGISGSQQSSVRGSVDRQTQTPQPAHLQPSSSYEGHGDVSASWEHSSQLATELNAAAEISVDERPQLAVSHGQADTRERRPLPVIGQEAYEPSQSRSLQPLTPDESSSHPIPGQFRIPAAPHRTDSSRRVEEPKRDLKFERRSLRSQHGEVSLQSAPRTASALSADAAEALPSPPPTQPTPIAATGSAIASTNEDSQTAARRRQTSRPRGATTPAAEGLPSAAVEQLQAAIREPETLDNDVTTNDASLPHQNQTRQVPRSRTKSTVSKYDKIAEQIVNEALGEETAEVEDSLVPSTPTAQIRRKRKREATPEAFEASRIAPTIVTMNDLTRDTKLGKKSGRERKLQERERQSAQKARELAQEQARRQAQSLMNGSENAYGVNDVSTNGLENNGTASAARSPSPAALTTRLAPRVRVVNGQLVQDEDSRVIDRHAALQSGGREGSDDDSGAVSEDELTRRVNSGSYMRRERHTKWTPDETVLFYEGLRMFGTDFMTISKLFPTRTRRQIKLKYNKEERAGTDGIERLHSALYKERRPADLAFFEQRAGIQLRNPADHESEMSQDRQRLEDEQAKETEAQRVLQLEREEAARAEAQAGLPADNESADQGKATRTGGRKRNQRDNAVEALANGHITSSEREDSEHSETEPAVVAKKKASTRAKLAANATKNDNNVQESSSAAEDNTSVVAGRVTRRTAAAATKAKTTRKKDPNLPKSRSKATTSKPTTKMKPTTQTKTKTRANTSTKRSQPASHASTRGRGATAAKARASKPRSKKVAAAA